MNKHYLVLLIRYGYYSIFILIHICIWLGPQNDSNTLANCPLISLSSAETLEVAPVYDCTRTQTV